MTYLNAVKPGTSSTQLPSFPAKESQKAVQIGHEAVGGLGMRMDRRRAKDMGWSEDLIEALRMMEGVLLM